MNPFAPKTAAYILIVLNIALAITITAIEPSKWIVIPLGGMLLPLIYTLIALAYRHAPNQCANMSEVHEHLAMGALVLTSALGLTLTDLTGLVAGDLGDRFIGAMLAMLIVFFGNRMPKESAARCDSPVSSVLTQRVHRRVGYVMVIAGMLMAASWIILPVPAAETLFISIGVLMLIVILALASQCLGRRETISN